MAILLSEGRRPLEFLLSEASGSRSRDNITIVSGSGVLKPGTVLGKITTGGKYQPSPATGSNGAQVGSAILAYPVDATSADVVVAAIVRDAEVNGKLLVYEATVNDNTKTGTKNAELASTSRLIVR